MGLTMDSKLKELMENPEAVALLEKYSPGFTENPKLNLGMNFKLSKCVKFPQANMTDEQIAEFEKELLALD